MEQNASKRADSAKSAIVRPDAPWHHMFVERVDGAAVARVGDRVLARSTKALRVREIGKRAYAPVLYFPPEDVDSEALVPTNVVTTCPLKGSAAAFDIAGDPVIGRGAWSYQRVLDFDRRLTELECCVAFDASLVEVVVDNEGDER